MEKQQLYAFDYDREERRLLDERDAALAAKREAADEALRQSILNALSSRGRPEGFEDQLVDWSDVREFAAERGIQLDGEFYPDSLLQNAVCGILSARAGKPIGYRFRKLVEVAHHLATHYPAALVPFGFVLRESGNTEIVDQEDRPGNWARRKAEIRIGIKARRLEFQLPAGIKQALEFLFPGLRIC